MEGKAMTNKQDFVDACIEEMAKKAILEGKGFEFMLYWKAQGLGWEKKAKEIFKRVIKRKGV